MPRPHNPAAPPAPREQPRDRRDSALPSPETDSDVAVQTPDEPAASERAEPTATRTIRDGEIQGHPRETPGDRDSQ